MAKITYFLRRWLIFNLRRRAKTVKFFYQKDRLRSLFQKHVKTEKRFLFGDTIYRLYSLLQFCSSLEEIHLEKSKNSFCMTLKNFTFMEFGCTVEFENFLKLFLKFSLYSTLYGYFCGKDWSVHENDSSWILRLRVKNVSRILYVFIQKFRNFHSLSIVSQ